MDLDEVWRRNQKSSAVSPPARQKSRRSASKSKERSASKSGRRRSASRSKNSARSKKQPKIEMKLDQHAYHLLATENEKLAEKLRTRES